MAVEEDVKMTSKSQMRTFDTCPAQWRYERTDAPTIAVDIRPLRFGGSVHEAIAEYYKEIDENGVKYVTKEGSFESLERHLSTVSGDVDRINKILTNMVNYEAARLAKYGRECFKPLFVEARFDIAPFKGIVDAVFSVKAGTKDVMVVDWKTGRYSPSEWDNDGMTIYSFFMEHEGYNVVQANTVFIEHAMQTLAIVNYDKVAAKAAIFFKKTQNPDYHFPKVKAWTCKWCPYILICHYEDDDTFKVETIPESVRMLERLELMRGNGHA